MGTKNEHLLKILLAYNNNLGDHAIALAQLEMVRNNSSNYEIVEISEKLFQVSKKYLKKSVLPLDIIVLSGGGDMGNQYMWIEKRRRDVIKMFPNNSIFIFPQTAYFTKDKNGDKELNNSKRIYGNHKHLTIIAREKISYEFLRKNFQQNIIELCPDIVLSLDKSTPQFSRGGALLCLRSDIEGKLTYKDITSIRNSCREVYGQVDITDTAYFEDIPFEDREKRLEEKLIQFKKHEVVITDRLHGLIFAAITGTPCIAIGNYNHKVSSIYDWLKSLTYIRYANDMGTIRKHIIELNQHKNNIYNSTLLEKYYIEIKKKILA